MGAAKDKVAECLPKCQPRNLPDSAITMFENCGTLTASQFLMLWMSKGESLKTVMINTHLAGFRISPAHLAARLKILACLLSVSRVLSAEPKSSAQILVTDRLGPSETRFIKKMKGLQHKRNKIELRGQPVLTPPKTSNKNEPSPMPEEKAMIEVYKHLMTFKRGLGIRKTFKTSHIHS